jgi:hypothetical protein
MSVVMSKDEFIERARIAVRCVLGGGPAEDSFVEFKTAFPDVATPESTVKAARQLAAQANAATPDPFVWVIGVEEKTVKVQGAGKKELSNWYSRVAKSFDGPPPTLSLSAILHDFDKPIVAVLFETDDAPYVVNLYNSRDRVVPWREATGQRCASRSELLKLLQHRAVLPDSRIIEDSKKTSLVAHAKQNTKAWSMRLHLTLYLENRASKRTILPAHDCSGWFEAPGLIERTAFTDFGLWVQRQRVSQAIIRDAEEVQVFAAVVMEIPEPREVAATAELQLGVVGANKPLVVRIDLPLRVQRPINRRSLSQLQAHRRRRVTYL